MADDKNIPPVPEPLKEGEVMPGQKKDKEWLREREAAPVPEPLGDGESMPEPHKAGKHEHRYQGFRGGGMHKYICAVCGAEKDAEETEEQAPEPEPVK